MKIHIANSGLFSIWLLASSLCQLFTAGELKAQAPFISVKEGPSRVITDDYFGQNVADIIYSRSLSDSSLRTKIPRMQPGTIRHVASSPSNWWDWRSGWLLSQKNILPGYEIRDDWAVLTPKPDKISDMKHLIDTTGARVIFVPNLLTSRLDYQAAAMFEFFNQNMQAQYVEMGCEFYLDNNESYERFPTSIQYADTATKWISAFRQLFPGLKIAVIGATEQTTDLSGRRNSWTQNVIDHASGFDAVTLHAYIPTGLNIPGNTIPKSSLPDLFARVFTTMEPSGEVGKELAKCPPGTEMWISEYNLTERNYAIHGLWAHGLFVASLTLSFLSDERITHVNQFQMSSDAFHGNIFATNLGFAGGPGYVSLHPNIPTKVNELTATGNAMQLVGRSLSHATSVAPLIFTPENGDSVKFLTGGYSSLIGYKVSKLFSDEMILMNLLGDSILLNVGASFNNDTIQYEILWWPHDIAERPFVEISGDMPVLSGATTTGEIYLPPYAIMRLYQNKNEIYVQATDDTICAGTTVSILAYGAEGYNWSPSVTTSGDQAVAYVAPLTTTTYVATATEGCSGPGCSKSVTIHVIPEPIQGTINVFPSDVVCPGTAVTLSVAQTDADKFCWTSPDVGSQFTHSSIKVIPDHDTTTYYLFGAKNECYSYRDSVKIYIKPAAHAGADILTCSGDAVMIGTPAIPGLTYAWTPATGLSDPAIAQPTATPIIKTSYVLKVTDPLAACSNFDTTTVYPVQCCQGSANSAVFEPHTNASDFLYKMLTIYNAPGSAQGHILKNYSGEIIINGDFYVDSTLTIQNCPRIRFGEKARIHVNSPGVMLKLQNDSLQPCGPFQWSGILSTNTISSVIIDSTFISGADTAFTTKNDATYQIKDASFYGNKYAIEIENYVGAAWSGSLIGIYGTTFEGDSSSVRGIGTVGVGSVTIGDQGEAPNIFSNMNEAITITNGDATVVNCHFQQLEYGVQLIDTFTIPELAPAFSATIGGVSNSEQNVFEDCHIAISTHNTELNARNNSFDNCDYGVHAKNFLGQHIEVSKNYMTNVYRGISFSANQGTSCVLKNNTISTKNAEYNYFPVAIGISDLSTDSTISETIAITGNEIYSGGLCAILISNNNGHGYDPGDNTSPQVTGNTIHLVYPGPIGMNTSGIRLENCLRNHIGSNIITGSPAANGSQEGITSFNVSKTHFFCNTLDSISNGMVFIGTNDNDSTWSNTFLKSDTCIKVGRSAVLYGRLNDQSGSAAYTPRNEFIDTATWQLVKLDTPAISYYTGNDELYPPLKNINFLVKPQSLPGFSCNDSLPIDSAAYVQTNCADTAAGHNLLQNILLNFTDNGTVLIDSNEDSLWAIANRCPLDCGDDIFIARALLQTKYDFLVFNDDSLCRQVPDTTAADSTQQPPFYVIYPNPAASSLTIHYIFNEDGVYALKFTDLLGREVTSVALPAEGGLLTLNISLLSAGCYFLSLYHDKDRMRVDKLVVMK